MSFWSKLLDLPGKIWRAVKKVANFFFNHRKEVEETGKAVGAVATAAASIFSVTKVMGAFCKVHGKGKDKKNETKDKADGKAKLNSKGKVIRHEDKKPVRKSKSPTEKLREDLDESSEFVQSFDPEERREARKLREESRGSDSFSFTETSFTRYDRTRNRLWNEIRELRAYFRVLSKASNDPDLNDLRKAVLREFETAYQKKCPNDRGTKVVPPELTPEELADEKAEHDAIMQGIKDQFDERVDYYLAVSTAYTEEEDENPPEGPSTSHFPKPVEGPQSQVKAQEPAPAPIKVELGKVNRLGWQPDGKYLIRNIFPIGRPPQFYLKDPDPDKRNLGDITAPNYVPMEEWRPGTPHPYAFPIEEENNYNWSEFNGPHQNEYVESYEDAIKRRGLQWCSLNLEMAEVFKDIARLRPCIFPNHPDYLDFRKRFESAYWDLVMYTPGLGDYGRVLGDPFGPIEEIERLCNYYDDKNDLSEVYGVNNPPSPEKVIYEIIQYGLRNILGLVIHVERSYPQVDLKFGPPLAVYDLYLQCITCPLVIEREHLQPALVEAAKMELREQYGLAFAGDTEEEEDDEDDDEEAIDDEEELEQSIFSDLDDD